MRDAKAMLEYFKPVMEYLTQQNEGKDVGWK
ncbi:MAG: M2 family metallopeptidase [Ignavibacteriae bacterium]|nr:M2 family metallopeptidase [Ignavibacteria bacterium]MBI3364404.1 M2 family metallopeptidase [Ignavibacteriota bacterium]